MAPSRAGGADESYLSVDRSGLDLTAALIGRWRFSLFRSVCL